MHWSEYKNFNETNFEVTPNLLEQQDLSLFFNHHCQDIFSQVKHVCGGQTNFKIEFNLLQEFQTDKLHVFNLTTKVKFFLNGGYLSFIINNKLNELIYRMKKFNEYSGLTLNKILKFKIKIFKC